MEREVLAAASPAGWPPPQHRAAARRRRAAAHKISPTRIQKLFASKVKGLLDVRRR